MHYTCTDIILCAYGKIKNFFFTVSVFLSTSWILLYSYYRDVRCIELDTPCVKNCAENEPKDKSEELMKPNVCNICFETRTV